MFLLVFSSTLPDLFTFFNTSHVAFRARFTIWFDIIRPERKTFGPLLSRVDRIACVMPERTSTLPHCSNEFRQAENISSFVKGREKKIKKTPQLPFAARTMLVTP